ERTQILTEKFFSAPAQADLTDIVEGTQAPRIVPIPSVIIEEELLGIINHLPNGKAPGLDGIPNEILKALPPEFAPVLAQAMSTRLAGGTLPSRFKESITIALRKEGKKDYSLPSSYRPIALENTLAKVLEKAIANRLSCAAEEDELLTWHKI